MDGRRFLMILMVAAQVLAGCEGDRSASPAAGNEALRSRTDAQRGRLWVLGLDDVRVHDAASKRLIKRIELPAWSVAKFVCAPDMVLDGSGSAIVSSNVQARLWRIDGNTFEVREYEIGLQERERWEIGFGALAFAPDGSMMGLAASSGTLWKIDMNEGRARLLRADSPLLNLCEFTPQLQKELERSR